MKIIEKINTCDILTIDIETVRLVKNFEDLSEDWQSAWEYKNKNEGVVPDYEDLCSLWEKSASLYAEFSKVCSVAITYLTKEGTLKCKIYKDADEVIILTQLQSDLDKFYFANRSYRLLGHAAKYFDYPFLCKRYILNGIDIPSILDESHCKPWEFRNLCTNELWRSFGTGSGSSLQALCTALNIPISKVDMVGDEVGAAYFEGRLEEIGEYCALDTIATYNIIRKFKKEPIFEFKDVIYIKDSVLSSPTEKPKLTDSIARSKSITKEQEKQIISIAKTLSKEEKFLYVETLEAALLEEAVNYEKLLTKIKK